MSNQTDNRTEGAGDSLSEARGLQELVRNHVAEAVSNQSFNQWYHERQFEQNILEGRPYFNGASPPPKPERHSPSKLLQCHRKITYRDNNAPEEGASPDGLYWIGDEFEEGIIVPYLQAVATSDETYVRNSMWFDTEIETDSDTGPLQVKGTTDPVITDGDGDPLLVTEIKTTSSVGNLSSPKRHHRAQLHAYLYGLTQESDSEIRDGLLLYGARDTLDIKTFQVTFSADFWRDTVVEWMQTQTDHRDAECLPPADPVFSWECEFCSYQNRCGEAATPYQDYEPVGLLPVFTEYREQQLEEYLAAHTDIGAKLTPTLAHEFPQLAAEYGAYDWQCTACGTVFEWGVLETDEAGEPPVCPECIEENNIVRVSGPEPEEQQPS